MASLLSDLLQGTSHCVEFLRSESVRETLSPAGIRLRRLFAPLLRLVYATQTDYRIIIDRREPLPPTKLGRIFAINHRQADDIVIGANAVGRSGYIVFGNPYLAFETTNGLGLWAYGMILLERDKPASRRAVYEKMKYVIQNGGNVIIYPEGYWNLDDHREQDGHHSDCWLVQDINLGILRLARETGCQIVPTVLHYDEWGKKRCYARRCAPLTVASGDDLMERKDALVQAMVDAKFGLMELYSRYDRRELEKDEPLRAQWERLKQELVRACDIPRIGYRLDLGDEKRIGKARVPCPIASEAEAFAPIRRLGISLKWEAGAEKPKIPEIFEK